MLGATPTLLAGSSTYRFFVTGSFAPGEVVASFAADSFTSNGIGNLADTERFTIAQLTGDLLDPLQGTTPGAQDLNSRGYFEVTYTLPSGATSLDVSSVTDLTPEFTVGASDGITLDDTQAPVLVSRVGPDYTFRYFYTGTHTGDVHLTFVDGAVSFLDAGSASVPTTLTAADGHAPGRHVRRRPLQRDRERRRRRGLDRRRRDHALRRGRGGPAPRPDQGPDGVRGRRDRRPRAGPPATTSPASSPPAR